MDAIDFENHDEIMKIFDWCKNTKPLALTRLAELVPIFEENATWHPIAFRLINEFGDIQDVLNNLDANMGTFSWVGSIVPLLESQKEIFVQIQSHPVGNVSQWANLHLEYINKRIKDEKNRAAISFSLSHEPLCSV